jgi:hypothetical protein
MLNGCGASSANDRSPAAMAEKGGLPKRLLPGLGDSDVAHIRAQKIQIDILDHNLVGVGESS